MTAVVTDTSARAAPPPPVAAVAPLARPVHVLRRRRPLRALRLLLPAAIALPLLFMAAGTWLAWRDAWHSAERELARGADAAAEYALRVIDGLRLAGDLANHALRGLSDEAVRAREDALHAELRALLASLPGVLTLGVSDRNAEILLTASAAPVPRGVSIADREWVRALRRPDAPALYVSAVTTGRLDPDLLFFAVGRRRTGSGNGLPEGTFDGTINVSVDPNRLAAGFATINGEPGDVTALVRTDGAVLAHSNGLSAPPPPVPPDSRLHAAIAAGEARGIYTGRALGLMPAGQAGEPRLIAFRQVGDLPLYVTVARPTPLVTARWREAVAAQLAVGTVATLALVGLALLVGLGQRRLAAANAGLERRVDERTAELSALADALSEANRRHAEILASIGEPLCSLDAEGRVAFASARALAFWGKAPGEILGRRFDDEFPQGVGSAIWEAKRRGMEGGEEVHLCAISPLAQRWTEVDIHPRPDRGITIAFRDIHDRRAAELDRRRAESALRESEERFRLVAESAPVMLWMGDRDGRCVYLNQALRAFWGVSLEKGSDFDWTNSVHPEDRDALFGPFAQAMRARTGFAVEARYRQASGEYRTLRTVARPRFGAGGEFLGMVGVNVDVTETRRAEAALRDNEARLRDLLATLDLTAVMARDLDGTIRFWSAGCQRLYGWAAEEAVGHLTHELLATRFPIPLPEIEAILLREGEWRGDLRQRRRDGSEVIVAAHKALRRDAEGRPVALAESLTDVTALRRAEERQALLMREVDHRAKNALAVVHAAVRLTPKDDPAAFARAVEGRVAALARAHTMLAQGRWEGAALRALIEAELTAFLPAGGGGGGAGAGGGAVAAGPAPRVEVVGPDLTLAPAAAQALSMALHELATNATKYGALSVPGGSIVVSWRVDRGAGEPGPVLRLRWQERGGPPVLAPPARRGFGSRVIEATVKDQLGGRVERRWDAAGLACELAVPLARVLAADGRGGPVTTAADAAAPATGGGRGANGFAAAVAGGGATAAAPRH